jgi:hypothetical protein
MTIDVKNSVATVEDVKELTRNAMDASAQVSETRQTYLSWLIGTTQAELRGTKDITDEMQAKSLAIVHKRFYPAVLEVVATADIADVPRLRAEEKTRRSLERNRRSNFARSAYSTVKSWLKSGSRDFMALKPDRVTKSQLLAETPRSNVVRAVKPDKVRERVTEFVEKVLNSTRQLANSDAAGARAILDEALQRIAKELFQGAGVTPTTDAVIAAKEHRPLRTGNMLFFPTETQVIRRQRLKAAA